jgi:lysophospholipase L1-like esterase
VRAVTDQLGPAAFDPDGTHLSHAAYQALVPQIAKALHTVSR